MTSFAPNAVLVERRDLNESVAIVRVAPESGELPHFEPGQYAELALADEPGVVTTGKHIRRSYSIASSPTEKGYLEFFLVLVPGGILTPKLWSLSPGDKLWLGPKIKGKFTLDGVPSDKDFVMISTGTGLAPFVSMLRAFHDQNRWRRLVIINGSRYAQDLGYAEELKEFTGRYPNVFYIPIVTREPEGSPWSGLRGRVQTVLDDKTYQSLVGVPLDPQTSQIFLCGNPDMIDTVEALLEARGFRKHSKKNPGNIHFERYW